MHVSSHAKDRNTYIKGIFFSIGFAYAVDLDWEESFREAACVVGPQSWRRFLPGLYWISKWFGPRPTKEWKKYVDGVIQSMNALSPIEKSMLWYKVTKTWYGDKNISEHHRHLADW